MKITAPTKSLRAACQLVSPAVAARTTRPILSNVKATAEGDALTLTAFDTEVGIRHAITGVQVQRAGSVILAIDRLTQILRECGDGEITLAGSDDGTKAAIGTSRFEMPGYPVDEFPELPAMDAEAFSHESAVEDIRRLIRSTAFAADKKDSTRFALSGVLWEADAGGTVRLVATDSKRLAVCEASANVTTPAAGKHLIPLRALRLVDQLPAEAGLVRVSLRPNEAAFEAGGTAIYTRLIEGRYPPWRDLIGHSRKAAGVVVSLPAADFLARVRLAAIMTDAETKRVDMTFEAGRVSMRARGAAAGSSEVALDLPGYDGPEVEIAFDPQYLIDFLRAAGEAEVSLAMKDGQKPAIFRAGEGYTYLVMPLCG